MALKDLLVILDETPACSGRIALATELAQRLEAHLCGLFVIDEPYIPAYIRAQIPNDAFEVQRSALLARAEEWRATFEQATRAQGVAAEFRTGKDHVPTTAVVHARHADLTIVGQFDPKTESALGVAADLVETLVFDTGRPILVTPKVGASPSLGRRIVVAWDGGRESARAVSDAIPFLEAAERVVVLTVNSSERVPRSRIPGADIALHLARHEIDVELSQSMARDISIGDAILNKVSDEGADLLVMGAYGHSRISELILGGTTRHMLEHMTVPVLMSR